MKPDSPFQPAVRPPPREVQVIESWLRKIVFTLIAAILLYLVGRSAIRPIAIALSSKASLSPPAQTPALQLYQAAYAGNVARLEALLKAGAAVNGEQPYIAPLEIAARMEHRDAVRVLLSHGADPNRFRYDSPFCNAVNSMPELIPDFLARGANVNYDRDRPSELCPLTIALLRHNLPVARLLLQRGADVNPKHPVSEWPIQWWHFARYKPSPSPVSPLAAAVCYAPELKETLLSRGAELCQDRATVLIGVTFINRPDVVPMLISLGADVNGEAGGETPLTQALRSAPKAVPILLERGARPDVLTSFQQSPLVEASIRGDVDSARLLLAHHAKVNFHAERGHTALWYAQKHHRTEVIQILLKAGGRNL